MNRSLLFILFLLLLPYVIASDIYPAPSLIHPANITHSFFFNGTILDSGNTPVNLSGIINYVTLPNTTTQVLSIYKTPITAEENGDAVIYHSTKMTGYMSFLLNESGNTTVSRAMSFLSLSNNCQGAFSPEFFTDNHLNVLVGTNNHQYMWDSPSLSVNEWHSYAVTYDDPYIKHYIDGILLNTTTTTGTGGLDFGNCGNGQQNIKISTDYISYGNPWSEWGLFQTWATWNDTLNDTEIARLEPAPPCATNYACNGYSSCGITDNASCNSVTDLNFCSITYTGNYSEFEQQTCNYCDPAINGPNFGTCLSNNQTKTYYYTNTCCATTGLTSDCVIPTNTTQSCEITPYSPADIAPAAANALVIVITEIASFIGLIILASILIYAKKNINK